MCRSMTYAQRKTFVQTFWFQSIAFCSNILDWKQDFCSQILNLKRINKFGFEARLLFQHVVVEARFLFRHFGFEAKLLDLKQYFSKQHTVHICHVDKFLVQIERRHTTFVHVDINVTCGGKKLPL